MCGVDPGFYDYPFLFLPFPKLDEVKDVFKYGICVKACPVSKDDKIECKLTSRMSKCKNEDFQPYVTGSTLFSVCIPT